MLTAKTRRCKVALKKVFAIGEPVQYGGGYISIELINRDNFEKREDAVAEVIAMRKAGRKGDLDVFARLTSEEG